MPSFANIAIGLRIAVASWVAGGFGGAWAEPVVEWVTPPAWLQTQVENAPARPGARLVGPSWLSTGRGGAVQIRIDREQVEIEENGLWEWSAQSDSGIGNAVQGRIRISRAPSRAVVDSGDWAGKGVRLYANSPWMLVIDAGNNAAAAEALARFLSNSGYPVGPAMAIRDSSGVTWEIWLDGFASNEAAKAMALTLRGLAPGIISATPTNKMVGAQLHPPATSVASQGPAVNKQKKN